jgi:hypothetical protein
MRGRQLYQNLLVGQTLVCAFFYDPSRLQNMALPVAVSLHRQARNLRTEQKPLSTSTRDGKWQIHSRIGAPTWRQ